MPSDEVADLMAAQAVAGLRSLVRSGEDLLSRAQPLAPIEEGTLRGSAELAIIVNGQRFEGAGAHAAAEFAVRRLARAGALHSIDVEASFNTIYAAIQHERKDFIHPLDGQADYLGAPYRANVRRYMRAMELEQAAAIRG